MAVGSLLVAVAMALLTYSTRHVGSHLMLDGTCQVRRAGMVDRGEDASGRVGESRRDREE